jgi:type IV pilus biogenesis protein CpaD/CtpE
MPRFHFDMRDEGVFVPDEEGEDLPDLNAAERVAAETAAEFGRDKLPKGVDRKVVIEVRNEHGQRVLTATVWLEVIRVTPEPQPPKPK